MQIKLLGGACLLAVGAIAAVKRASLERRRLDVLDAWIRLLTYLRAQIDRNLTPLDQILANADKALFLSLTASPPRDLPTLLASSRDALDERSLHALRQLSAELGNGYRSDQVHLCDVCLAELKQARTALAAELPARIRLAVTMSLCISLGAIVLLW